MTAEVALLALLAGAANDITIAWDAPSECPEREELRSRVEGLLGRGLEGEFERRLAVTAVARKEAESYGVVITTIDGDGNRRERSIEGATCEAIVDATALVIALAIDPSSIAWQTPPPPPPPVTTSTAARTQPPGLPTNEADGLRAPGIPFLIPIPRLDFRVGARAGAAVLPDSGIGFSFGGAILWDVLRFQTAGTVWLDRQVSAVPNAKVGLWSVEGEVCYAVLLSELFELPSCVGAEIGRFAADSVDQMTPPTRAFWGGSTLSTGLAFVPIEALAFVLDVEGVLSWIRPEYEVDDAVVRMGRAGVRAGLWVELRVP